MVQPNTTTNDGHAVLRAGSARAAPWAAALAMVLAAAAPALAQSSIERFQRSLEQLERQTRMEIDPNVPLGQRLYFDYGAYLTVSVAAIDDAAQSTHLLRQYDLTGYAHLSIDGVHDFFLRGTASYQDFNRGESFDGEGDSWDNSDLERAYYRFDLGRMMSAYHGRRSDWGLTVSAGRQLVHWTTGLVLSQELDGVLATVTHGPWELTALAAVTNRSAIDFDSSRPRFDDRTYRGWFGALAAFQATPVLRLYAYGLAQRDFNERDEALVVSTLGGDITTRFKYESHYLGLGAGGPLGDRFAYVIEGVFQGGRTLSNSFDGSGSQIPQGTDDIAAWAMNAQVDYLPGDAHRTRLGLEIIIASGDPDRVLSTSNTFGGNTPGTDDRAFNALGLLNTGLAFAPPVSNLTMARLGASTYPFPSTRATGVADGIQGLQVGGEVFVFARTDDDAPIHEPVTGGSYLGCEVDVYVNWQITSDLSVAGRYGVFFPGGGLAADKDERHFAFVAVTLGF